MASNHLEDLVAQWYEFQGYFVRRNIQVGKRARGGYGAELDVVAFKPGAPDGGPRLVHVECSLDADSWATREVRFARKFEAGRGHIPALFAGFTIPAEIDQVALLLFAAHGTKKARTTLGGGRVIHVSKFVSEILAELKEKWSAYTRAVPEQFPLVRTLQFVAEFWSPPSSNQSPTQVPSPVRGQSTQQSAHAI